VKSKTVLVFFLVLGAVFAGCIGAEPKTTARESVDAPPATVSQDAGQATVISNNEVAALEQELSEIEDFLLEIESVDIDISELDEAFFA